MNNKTFPDLDRFFAILAASNPTPRTELVYHNPFTLLIAVLLSAQATDISVNRATESLFSCVDTPQKMLDLGEVQLRDFIKTIGLFNNKARNIIKLCKILLAEHDGKVPNERVSLEALPGVGRKTANVVLNEAFGQPTIAVDTHIFRISNRTGIAPGATVLEVENLLEERVPERWKKHAHHWLILLGRYTCKARKPNCFACQVSELCAYQEKNLIGK